MNRRMMTFAAVGAVVALSVPVFDTPTWAQTAGPIAGAGSAQPYPTTDGTASPAVRGVGKGAQLGVASTDATTGGQSGTAAGLTATAGAGISTPPMAGNISAQANAGTIGTAELTGMTMTCASISAVVGVLPAQMPSDCLP